MVVVDVQYVWCNYVDYFNLLVGKKGVGGLGLDAHDGCVLAFMLT